MPSLTGVGTPHGHRLTLVLRDLLRSPVVWPDGVEEDGYHVPYLDRFHGVRSDVSGHVFPDDSVPTTHRRPSPTVFKCPSYDPVVPGGDPDTWLGWSFGEGATRFGTRGRAPGEGLPTPRP